MEEGISLGSVIELLPGKDGVYKNAVAGSRGTVRRIKDDEGFQMVFIEWDQDDPLYNGEPNGWTFASHFKVVDGSIEDLNDSEDFIERVRENMQEGESVDDFLNRMTFALAALSDCESFLVVTTRRTAHPEDKDRQVIIPYIYSSSLSEQAMIALETQVVQLAAVSFQEMSWSVLASMEGLADEDDEDDEDDGRVS